LENLFLDIEFGARVSIN